MEHRAVRKARLFVTDGMEVLNSLPATLIVDVADCLLTHFGCGEGDRF